MTPDQMRTKFGNLARDMSSVASQLTHLEHEISNLIRLANEPHPDPEGLLERCHEFLTGQAPVTVTKSCLISDLCRMLGR